MNDQAKSPVRRTSVPMKFYGHRGSICTNRVLFAFAEKGAEPVFVPVDLAKGEHKSAEHFARHPFGMIPVLEDGDFSLYESRAIVRYLDRVLGGEPLTPRDARPLAEMERWISVEYSYASPPVGELVRQKFVVPAQGGATDPQAVERARGSLSRAFDVLDGALRQRPYFASDAFTLADVSVAPLVEMLFALGEGGLVGERSGLAAWWARVSARPGWRHVVGDVASGREARVAQPKGTPALTDSLPASP